MKAVRMYSVKCRTSPSPSLPAHSVAIRRNDARSRILHLPFAASSPLLSSLTGHYRQATCTEESLRALKTTTPTLLRRYHRINACFFVGFCRATCRKGLLLPWQEAAAGKLTGPGCNLIGGTGALDCSKEWKGSVLMDQIWIKRNKDMEEWDVRMQKST